MHSLALLVAAASLGVDYGWQPDKDGQLEYIIQIEPALFDVLRQGQEVVSEIHPDAKDVRRFRILIGKGDLPRVNLPEPEVEEQPPEQDMLFRKPPIRELGDVSRTEFNGDAPREPWVEPEPELDAESLNIGPRKRRTGRDFRSPDEPVEEARPGPLQPDSLESDHPATPLRNRAVGYTEGFKSRDKSQDLSNAAVGSEKAKPETSTKTEPAKPWLPLFVTVVLLFGSIGGNAYLAWLAKDFYGRYRKLSDELRGPRAIDG